MKTKNVVALVFVTVAALSSVACGDASMEEVGATGSASSTSGVSNGEGCEGQLGETVCQSVGGQPRLFVCYDASQSGSEALPQWGNSGKSCSLGHANDAVVNQGGTQNDTQGGAPSGGGTPSNGGVCPDGPTRCNSAGKLENCAGPNGYYVASDQGSLAAVACHNAATPPPATPVPTPQNCKPGTRQCTYRSFHKDWRLEKCASDGSSFVTESVGYTQNECEGRL